MINPIEFSQQITQLLLKAKLSPTILSLTECAKGGNNRTYKLETSDGCFAVKKYFRREDDKRDRLASEFAFLSYAKIAAPKMVPIPYSKDDEAGIALYEFVQGVPLQAGDITEKEVAEASQFFCALNTAQMKSHAVTLPLASEACFSIEEHLNLVSARICELQKIKTESDEDNQARDLIAKLNAHWQNLLIQINYNAMIEKSKSLAQEQRCISPSDFGFHNALRLADGNIRFLDFEYAGWDDPAKMVGDFFAQLAIPVHADFFTQFVSTVMQPFAEAEYLIQRAQLLRRVYQVKWCCIALNIFLPVHLARRKFANPDLDVLSFKQAQLKKVERLIENLV